MARTPFSRRRFLQLSGGLALAGVSLPLWAHDMADMAGGDTHPALRLPEPYKIKLAINKSAVCLAPVAVAEQQKIFSKYNLDVEFVNFGNSTDVPLQANPTIIEDNCFIGARSEVVEGVIVEEGSVISMGVYIGQSTRIYDRETGEVHYGRVPAGSVVVSGNLPSKDGKYSLYCAVIVKKVDAKTRGKVGINELLRTID